MARHNVNVLGPFPSFQPYWPRHWQVRAIRVPTWLVDWADSCRSNAGCETNMAQQENSITNHDSDFYVYPPSANFPSASADLAT